MKNLIKNISYIYVLQFLNYTLPVITIPFVLGSIGIVLFGQIAFCLSIMAYFILITDYGFNLSGTKKISINRDSPEKINNIINHVFQIKVILTLFSIIIIIFITHYFDIPDKNKKILNILILYLIGQASLPAWIFQGLQNMAPLVIIQVIFKIIQTIGVLVLVRSKEDFIIYVYLISLPGFAASVASLVYLKYKYSLKLILPNYYSITEQMKDGWHIFYATFATSVYNNSIIFALGLISGSYSVGVFAIASKVIFAARCVYSPISQGVYPYASRLIDQDKKQGLNFIKKLLISVSILTGTITGLLWIYADLLVSAVFEENIDQIVQLVRIMSPIPLLIAISNIIGIVTMVNLGMKKQFARATTLTALIGLLLAPFLIYQLEAVGAALSITICEFIIIGFLLHSMKEYNAKKNLRSFT